MQLLRTKRWMASSEYTTCTLLYPRLLALERVPLGLPTGQGYQSCFKVVNLMRLLLLWLTFFALQSSLRSVKLDPSLPITLASFCQPCVLPFLAWANVLTGWKNGLRALCHRCHCWKLASVSDMLLNRRETIISLSSSPVIPLSKREFDLDVQNSILP